ncbi:O-antigen ligase family protein [Nocardia mangyaensis]|uniref:O-antigen ligase family protein n=1 Tax=Nocardia mangyaensis TaxID=2213200 RepID=UPI002675E169|nr:O-antigen ligase family protein [Nocardia mangyaensis]MDO3650873.1 O-antigen ligase family protein [Nocardia mangyaensis]
MASPWYLAAIPLGWLFLRWIWDRPQRGLLLVAALVPFNGLLEIAPAWLQVTGWKELLLVLTLAVAAFVPHRPSEPRPALAWWPVGVALCAFGVISAFVTAGTLGLFAIKITFFYFVVVPLILYLRPFTARDRDLLVTIMMVESVGIAAFGVAQQAIGGAGLARMGYEYNETIRFAGGLLRSFSTFNQPFPFAFYLVTVLLVGGSVAMANPRRPRNRMFLMATPILLVGLAATVVRAALVGLLVGVLVLAVVRYRKELKYAVLGGVGLIVVGAFAMSSQARSSLFSSSSLADRGTGWTSVMQSIGSHPFGDGLGSTGAAKARQLVQELGPMAEKLPYATGEVQIYGRPYQPDNYYMKLLIELGPIGLWLFAVILVVIWLMAIRGARTMRGPDSALALGIAASVLACAVSAVASSYFEIFPSDFYFWLLAGVLGCALTQQSASETGARNAVPEQVS